MIPLAERLSRGPYPVWYDGAKGTMLAKHLEPGAPSEILNLTAPSTVRAIHQAYVDAGAQMIQTNTFNGTMPRLSLHDSTITDEKVYAINKTGAEIARQVAGNTVYVAGSMGPLGSIMEADSGDLSDDAAVTAFETQARGLIDGGVNLLHIETAYSVPEVLAAITAIRKVSPTMPIMASMSFTSYHSENGFATMNGVRPAQLITLADEHGLLAYGANCGNGFDHLDRLLGQLHSDHPQATLVMKLNAGMPTVNDKIEIYLEAVPEKMSLYAEQVYKAGARIIGACCGSTPDLINSMVKAFH
ncbi:MAG: homocysteine S-methyltransferase family protein [Patescibacteria group bacterium]